MASTSIPVADSFPVRYEPTTPHSYPPPSPRPSFDLLKALLKIPCILLGYKFCYLLYCKGHGSVSLPTKQTEKSHYRNSYGYLHPSFSSLYVSTAINSKPHPYQKSTPLKVQSTLLIYFYFYIFSFLLDFYLSKVIVWQAKSWFNTFLVRIEGVCLLILNFVPYFIVFVFIPFIESYKKQTCESNRLGETKWLWLPYQQITPLPFQDNETELTIDW